MAFLLSEVAADGQTASTYARVADITAFIDMFPIASYSVNDRTYITAEDLARYGFKVKTDSTAELTLSFDSGSDFVPMAVSEINVIKADVIKAKAAYPLDAGARKVTLDGMAVQSYSMGEKSLIPF